MLFLVACLAAPTPTDPRLPDPDTEPPADTAADADTDMDTDADTDTDTDADTAYVFNNPDFTGFSATSDITGEISGAAWCAATVAITGARDDTVCEDCEFAFTLAAVETFTAGEADCVAPILASMAADDNHLEPFLAYAMYGYTYGEYGYAFRPEWYVGYKLSYTVMDVQGVITTRTSRSVEKRFFDERHDDLVGSASGFTFDGSLTWWQPPTPNLWTACTYTAASDDNGPGILGATVREDVKEYNKYGDRWVLPLHAGDHVDLAVDAVANDFPGAGIYIVRPDGCLGQVPDDFNGFACTRGTGYCPSPSFTANEDGDWHIVVVVGPLFKGWGYDPSDSEWGDVFEYDLGVQVNGVDLALTLVDDDAELYTYRDYSGRAQMNGSWVPAP